MKKSIIIIGSVILMNSCLNNSTKQNSKNENKVKEDEKANIIVILADDMGYSDIGCYGGEIQTPNIDSLGNAGIRFTQFYNSSRCCPSRASLLTGVYSHNTGMGWMTASNLGEPGYTGDLNNQCITIPQLLKKGGYQTYMSGKWHVTHEEFTKENASKHNWPLQRGFDRFFGTIKGGGDYFDPPSLTVDNQQIDAPKGFYYTDAISDSAAAYINYHHQKHQGSPFFMYVAYTAPHWPLHAKPEDIKKYMGKYMKGWDSLRVERYLRMLELGILDTNAMLPVRDPEVPSWESQSDEEKKWWDMRMAIYAAQMDCMDKGIGRITKTLKTTSQFENTIILFLSDNGACDEAIPDLAKSKKFEDLGTKKSFETYRKPWANYSNTPFRYYKSTEYEGGIRTPLIISWPQHVKAPFISNQIGHIVDFFPTFMDIAKVEYPESFDGKELTPLQGKSLIPLIEGHNRECAPLFWEHEACRAVRQGDWKLVSLPGDSPDYKGEWELYNLAKDPTETNNLAEEHPDKLKEISKLWNTWAESNKVYPLNGMGWNERIQMDVQDEVE